MPFSQTQLQQKYQDTLALLQNEENVRGVDIGYADIKSGAAFVRELRVRVHRKDRVDIVEPRLVQLLRLAVAEGDDAIHVVRATYALDCGKPVKGGRAAGKHAVLVPGVGVSVPSGPPGSIGLIVGRPAAGGRAAEMYAISCAHVLDRPSVVHPAGSSDGIGTVVASMCDREGDAVLVSLNNGIQSEPVPLGAAAKPASTRAASFDDPVTKSGLITGVSCGDVEGIGTYFFDYAIGRVGIEGFRVSRRRSCSRTLSDAGDSGAAWLSESDNAALGIHVGRFRDRTGAEYAVACHLPPVLKRLGAQLL